MDRIGPPARHIADDRRLTTGDVDAPEQAAEELVGAVARKRKRTTAARRMRKSEPRASDSDASAPQPSGATRPVTVPLAERLTLVRGETPADTDAPAEPVPTEPMPRSISGA